MLIYCIPAAECPWKIISVAYTAYTGQNFDDKLMKMIFKNIEMTLVSW